MPEYAELDQVTMEQKIDENEDGFGDKFGRNRTKTVEICVERGVNCTVACRMG